ncbi:hypothetical protein LUZ60_015548 [Juncus effusus]|nr:hypothetical protein LUZ60_015548 [Juncus effusus]
MRKKLDTRFPAARIKKIMQADEDVGKIALAVPVLVSKALELFLQDLCDRTYNVSLQRGMKTMSSLHLKQCVHGFNHYDFLRDIVSKVPDMGSSDGVPAGDDKPTRRRKATEDDESEEESKRARTETTFCHSTNTNNNTNTGTGTNTNTNNNTNTGTGTNTNTNSGNGTNTGTGRGRGRPRGSGKGRRSITRGTEDDPGSSPDEPGQPAPLRNFDLNLDVTENALARPLGPPAHPPALAPAPAPAPAPGPPVHPSAPAPGPPAHPPAPAPGPPAHPPVPAPGPPAHHPAATHSATPDQEGKHEEYPGWSMEEMNKMAVDPVQFALAHGKVEEEDYDEEEG